MGDIGGSGFKDRTPNHGGAAMEHKRILLVEDEPLLAKGVQKLLTRYGYQVLGPVVNGEDAIRHAEDSAPDLVLMDIALSGSMDGIQAAEKIRSVRDIPVIYLTASSDESTLERAKVTEPHGYVLKPFSERELYVTVETALYKAAMEKRVKDSEQRYRSLFEHCPTALFEVDLSSTKEYLTSLQDSGIEDIGDYLDTHDDEWDSCIDRARVIGANQAALDLFGVSASIEFERDLKRFFDRRNRQPVREYLKSIAQGSPFYRSSADLKTFEGKSISVEWTSSVLDGHAQPFSRVSVCLLDVTETKKAQEELAESNRHLQKEIRERTLAEEALRQSEVKYRAIFDNAAMGINMVDENARFMEKNAALCRILGYPSSELDRLSAFDLTHPDDLEASVVNHRALVNGDSAVYRLEKRYVRKDGEVVWADLSASAIRDQVGRYLATVAVITDITDRKRYEHSQAQLMDEIMNFAYIVSHDLRSPLVNLRGFSRELTDALETVRPAVALGIVRMPEQAGSQVREAMEIDIPECLAFMGSSISHMNNQVNGILTLARLGRTELDFEPLSMNDVVEQILATFAYEISERDIAVTVHELPDIHGDRTSIDQIMANLIGNAVKYLESDRQGRLSIRGERLLEETRFEVRDNGRGIREEDLERIFDIFQRTGRTDVPGEGLGLSCVRTLVRRHGGRVWCESTPSVGSTFYFTIAHEQLPLPG
jgi:PAS domain S-box-containing protein